METLNFPEFLASFSEFLEASPALALDEGSRIVFLSDLHMGDGGSRDDLEPNRVLAMAALAGWYLERGYTLVLGGDIEDTQKFSWKSIRKAWRELYGIFDAFAERGALWKIVGNHDLALLRERDYPYPLHHGLRLEGGGRSLFCFHGHQASRLFVKYNYLGDFVVRYLAKPLNVRNSSVSGDSRQAFKTERRIYRASKKLGIVSICGHTHRPLFESHSKYDSLRWSIEELLREYPESGSGRRARIEELVDLYRAECERLGRGELRWELTKSLYEEKALLIPCVFNSGCATGKNGITAIEVEGAPRGYGARRGSGGRISLVHWAREGRARPYLVEEALLRDRIEGSDASRYLLKQAELDQVFARIDLLGRRGADSRMAGGI
jgi:UDP-2,3-diacylglucosamine pyrophosphatase LpxH